jgi:hypothetical protein
MSQRNERWTQPGLEIATHWLIHHAARAAPESLSSRLQEEWLADLESRCSPVSKLRLALGCCWATVVIVYDYSRIRVPAATPAVATRGYITRADRNFGYFSLRSGTLFLILGLHGALFCGLIATLSQTRGSATQSNLPDQVLNAVPIEITVIPGR